MKPILSFLRQIFPKWMRYYHQLEIKGIQNLPKDQSTIIAPNHSGGWDWDNLCLMSLLDHIPNPQEHRKRIWLCYWDRWAVQAGAFSRWVQQFSPIPINLEGKGIPYRLVDKIVQRKELIAIMPEGHSASIHEGYSLWRFYPGVIKLHLRYQIPIIPTAMIGFVHTAPIVSIQYNPHLVPSWEKEVMIPPIFPKKLKVIFGEPFEFKDEYDKDHTKSDLYALASQVRTKVKKLIQIHL